MTEPQPPAAKKSDRLLRGLGISLCALLAAFLLIEVVCRVVPIPGLTMDALDPTSVQLRHARVQPHPYMAYVNKPDFDLDDRDKGGKQVSHNSLGFRGPEVTWEKPAGVWRIVCLGGSSTYGFSPTSDATTWPARLEHHLNEAGLPAVVQVINGGCQGWSTFESLTNLSMRMVDLEPDLVIVYHAINDMRCALYGDVTRDNTNWRAIWPVERPGGLQKLIESSRTYLIYRRYATSWLANRQRLESYVIANFDPIRDQYAKDPDNLPELGFRNYRRNLESIVAVARQHGARVLFGSQAMRYGDIPHPPSVASQTRGLQRMKTILFEVGADLGVATVDTARVLEDEADRRRGGTEEESDAEDGIFFSEVHITDDGADLLARTFARKIVDEGWVE